MKQSFTFHDSYGRHIKAEFNGLLTLRGCKCKAFRFYVEIGASWHYDDTRYFKERATKQQIIHAYQYNWSC